MRHGFRLASILCVLAVLSPSPIHAGDKADSDKALDHFVGVWKAMVTNKPSKSSPDGPKGTAQSSVVLRALKNRFILGRDLQKDGDGKSLWLMTHDPKSNVYLFWLFNNKGLLGGEWTSTWNAVAKTLTGTAADTPKGWSSNTVSRFHDKTSNDWAAWMKDESGVLIMDMIAKKTRLPDAEGANVLTTWSETKKTEKLAPELKVLDRLVGTWDTVAVAKPALWTPKEVRTTSKVTRKWILDGRFLQDTSEISDGREGFSLLTFDPNMKKYRSWWFSSEGHHTKSIGDWDPVAGAISFMEKGGEGFVTRSSVRFVNKDREIWRVEVRNGEDQVCFDSEWTVTRRKEK